ncbi:MAG: Flp1 family type IVb pilin [Eubacteriales bacterium]|nr:Flp1 family type IVb pilin [Eubacteriales bacterium]
MVARVSRVDPNFLVVLIGLVIIFKDQLTDLVKNILSKITKQSNSI